ncbi:MAG TPA: glycosyltransferase family 4 protein [Candidatus Nanopelagicales bacterium]
MRRPLQHDTARLYDRLRTAHLERAHQLAPASILYRSRSYDFDESLTTDLDLRQVTTLQAARAVASSRLVALEINEPLMRAGALLTGAALLSLRMARLFGRPRTTVVSYAIENLDPFRTRPGDRRRSRLRLQVEKRLAHHAWRRIDRLVYGTESARSLYRAVLPDHGRSLQDALIPALPTVCSCGPIGDKEPGSVLFIGALDHRKGIDALLAAWPLVIEIAGSGPELTVIGKGPREAAVREATEAHDSIHLLVDPDRGSIHERLRSSQVVVLLSQRSPRWREQVGLPIVEGLAHGCSVVTTTESGLADWLSEHGHDTLDPDGHPEAVARSLERALARRRPAQDVLADLPDVDGRLAADGWLFSPTTSHPC